MEKVNTIFSYSYADQSDSITCFCQLGCCKVTAGRRGLMDSTLGSGDRVRGFKSRSRQSGFFWAFSSSSSSYILSLTCSGIILNHKVTRSGRDKERKKNPSSAICAANAEISAMYGEKKS